MVVVATLRVVVRLYWPGVLFYCLLGGLGWLEVCGSVGFVALLHC